MWRGMEFPFITPCSMSEPKSDMDNQHQTMFGLVFATATLLVCQVYVYMANRQVAEDQDQDATLPLLSTETATLQHPSLPTMSFWHSVKLWAIPPGIGPFVHVRSLIGWFSFATLLMGSALAITVLVWNIHEPRTNPGA